MLSYALASTAANEPLEKRAAVANTRLIIDNLGMMVLVLRLDGSPYPSDIGRGLEVAGSPKPGAFNPPVVAVLIGIRSQW